MRKLILCTLFLMAGTLYAADTKVTGYPELVSPTRSDLLYVVGDPGGTPVSRKATIENVVNKNLYPVSPSTGIANGTLSSGIMVSSIATGAYDPLLVLMTSSATSVYLQLSSASATYQPIGSFLTTSSAALTYSQISSINVTVGTLLTNSSATATYTQISSVNVTISSLLSNSSATATYLQISSASSIYEQKTDLINAGRLTGQISPSTGIANGVLSAGVRVSSFPETGIVAGSYTNANVTFNAQGMATTATNGTAGGGGSSLEIMVNSVSKSSPTSTIDFVGPFVGTISGSTAIVTMQQVSLSSGITGTLSDSGIAGMSATKIIGNNLPGGSTSYKDWTPTSLSTGIVGSLNAGYLNGQVAISTGTSGDLNAGRIAGTLSISTGTSGDLNAGRITGSLDISTGTSGNLNAGRLTGLVSLSTGVTGTLSTVPTYYYLTLLPDSAILDATNPPAITVIQSTGTSTPRFRVADFDASTAEIIYWSFVLPNDMVTGSWSADVNWFTNDQTASKATVWGAAISATAPGAADSMTEQSASTLDVATGTVNSTEYNRLTTTTIPLTDLDGAVANGVVTMVFERVAASGSDTLASDARLHSVRLRIPRG